MLTISADFRAKETLPLTLKLHCLLRILYSTFWTPLVGAWNGIEETFESIHRERTLSSYKNHCRHHRLNFRDCLKKAHFPTPFLSVWFHLEFDQWSGEDEMGSEEKAEHQQKLKLEQIEVWVGGWKGQLTFTFRFIAKVVCLRVSVCLCFSKHITFASVRSHSRCVHSRWPKLNFPFHPLDWNDAGRQTDLKAIKVSSFSPILMVFHEMLDNFKKDFCAIKYSSPTLGEENGW